MIYETKEVSLSENQFEEEGLEKEDFISSGETVEQNQINKNSSIILKKKLQTALSKLSKREAEIIKLRILESEKYTLAELSGMD
jgi:DNA-directed RNA polymerase sigma subunit (sigma70/sigma32)